MMMSRRLELALTADQRMQATQLKHLKIKSTRRFRVRITNLVEIMERHQATRQTVRSQLG